MSGMMASDVRLLRVTLPNKEHTMVPVVDEDIMLHVFQQICDRRQLRTEDFVLKYMSPKKKLEDVDLTRQYQQCCTEDAMLTEVILVRVKHASVLKKGESPYSVVGRAPTRVVTLSTTELSSNSLLPEPPLQGGGKNSTRLRSSSMSIREKMGLGSSKIAGYAGEAGSHESLTSSKNSLASTSSSPATPIPEEPADDLDKVLDAYASSSSSPVIVEGIEHISLRRDREHKTSTLQRKPLRPRSSSTVTSQSHPSLMNEDLLVRVVFGSSQTTVKVTMATSLETILREVCERKLLSFDQYSIELPDAAESDVCLDRNLAFYKFDPTSHTLRVVPNKEKSYSSMAISENGRDVLIFNVRHGMYEVSQATEQKLVERLTDEQEPDMYFRDVFLLTYRSYMTADDFFDLLVARFNAEPPADAKDEDLIYYNESIETVRRNVFEVLNAWMTKYWHDFVFNEELPQALSRFLEQIRQREDKYPSWKSYRERIQRTMDEKSGLMDGIFNVISAPPNAPPLPAESPVLAAKLSHIVDQLCLYDSKLFANCEAVEYLNMIWKRTDGIMDCPNVTFLIERFNRESLWVATEVVEPADPQKRLQALKRFIEIADECSQRNNLFSAFSILSGLNVAAVQKLRKTWAGLSSSTRKTYDDLEKLLDPSKNMVRYREALSQALPPILPFLPIFIKDLTFINDGNPARINGLINFDKLCMMAMKVREIVAMSAVPYVFEAREDLQKYIKNPPRSTLEKLIEVAELHE